MEDKEYQSVLRVRNLLLALAVLLAFGAILTGWRAFAPAQAGPEPQESGQPAAVSPSPSASPGSSPTSTPESIPSAPASQFPYGSEKDDDDENGEKDKESGSDADQDPVPEESPDAAASPETESDRI